MDSGMSAGNVIVAYGLVEIEHAVKLARAAARHGDMSLVVGITRYSAWYKNTRWTGWLVGLSWAGSPIAWVSAHRLKRHAEEQVGLVHRAAEHHDLSDDPTFATLIEQLTAQSDQALPPVPPAVGHD